MNPSDAKKLKNHLLENCPWAEDVKITLEDHDTWIDKILMFILPLKTSRYNECTVYYKKFRSTVYVIDVIFNS